MVAAVPMKNPDPFWNARLTVPAVISRFPVFFHEPRVSLNDSPRTPLGENWIEKMKLKLPSRLICSICAPSTRTAKYVPAILSPRPPSSSAKAGQLADFTYIHSISKGLAVGNYGFQGEGNPFGHAFIYNPSP